MRPLSLLPVSLELLFPYNEAKVARSAAPYPRLAAIWCASPELKTPLCIPPRSEHLVGVKRCSVSAQLDTTAAAHKDSRGEKVPWWQPAVPRMARREEPRFHIQLSFPTQQQPQSMHVLNTDKISIPTPKSSHHASRSLQQRQPGSSQRKTTIKMGRSWQCHRMSNINC
ncbi:hypothetical protein CesoFtcFv8_008346 [Champsocephalus esox]|uniref:Uncharacterized protein n=1 Tax=Champsocephalus esox TaxID=159716 RepID=A0AAN8C840_9TELE|nr:hypothetical protein CesoFtcFv8_008346 [Champsocephalus esox]